MKYVKEFADNAAYTAYTATDYPKPNVSLCVAEGDVHYNPTPPPLCKLTLKNGEVVRLEGSGTLTSAMTSPYSATCVSAEIGKPCTSIGNRAFYLCTSLSSITIPDSVTSIGDVAFHDCRSLSSITIPDSVTSIGSSAFYACSGLTSINIPSGVTSIGDYAFRDCFSLSAITSFATTAPRIYNYTFQNVKTGGTLTVPIGSSGYNTWMGTGTYYLGYYNWTKVEQ